MRTDKETLLAFYRVCNDMASDLVNNEVTRKEKVRYWFVPMWENLSKSIIRAGADAIEPEPDERIENIIDEIKEHHRKIVKSIVEDKYTDVCVYCVMLSELLGIYNLIHQRFYGKRSPKIQKAFDYLLEGAKHIPGLIGELSANDRICIGDDETAEQYKRILKIIFCDDK